MAKPHKCPVCDGAGRFVIPEHPWHTTTGGPTPKTCHGCGGTGVVWEPGAKESLTEYQRLGKAISGR